MAHALRRALSSFAKTRFGAYAFPKSRPRGRNNMVFGFVACNFLHTQQLTKNIELLTEEPVIVAESKKITSLKQDENRPLLVLLCWLLSKKPHIMKFANLYLEQGFDVVTVSINPWQLMWPVNGSKATAFDLLQILEENKHYERILLHGFSIGGYLWGELLDFVHKDRKRYDQVIDRIVGHVWDSAADISEITIGTPKAMFPNNRVLENMMRKYLEFHMVTFEKQATQYYRRSSQLFHLNLVRSPALFFVSKTDPVGSYKSNMRVRDSWDSLGTETHVKLFENTPHVGHFRSEPKEYIAELYSFLNKLQLIRNDEKFRARL